MSRWRLIFVCCLLACTACSSSGSNATGGSTAAIRPLADAALTEVENDRVVSLWVRGRPGERIDMAELAKYSDVTKMTFQECSWLTDDDLTHLAHLSELKTLIMIRIPISDAGLERIAPLPALDELQLFHTKVTGRGLADFQNSSLRRLEIHGDEPTADSLSPLGEVTSLRELVIRCPSVDLSGFTSLQSLSQLEALDVRLCQGLDESFVAELAPLPDLRTFLFESQGFDDRQLEGLCRIESLREIDLNNASVSDAALADLAALPELRRLSLDGCSAVTDSGLQALSASPHLETLYLSHSGVKGTGLADLRQLESLRYVSIFSGQLSRAGRATIAELVEARPELDIFVESQ